jgi:hypothetical protein
MAASRGPAYAEERMSSSKTIHPKPPPGVKEKRLESRFPVHTGVEVSWIDARGRVVTHEATVTDHSDHGLGLRLKTRIPTATMVWMRDVAGELVKAVVRFCRNHEMGDWQTGVRLVYREMRGTGREPVRGAAELKWPNVTGKTMSVLVRVVDLSDGGVGVIAPLDLVEGQSVQLIGEQFECFCAVRHSRPLDEGGYRIGLLFAREPHDRIHGVTAEWLD